MTEDLTPKDKAVKEPKISCSDFISKFGVDGAKKFIIMKKFHSDMYTPEKWISRLELFGVKIERR